MPKHKQKLKGVTFQLVHRSQQDPLVADETAPQRVLVPIVPKESKTDKENRIEEQHKYGIYFDDDYNYLQHLKDPKDLQMEWPEHVEEELRKRKEVEKAKVKLPSSVFASEVEEEVGMLNKAAPVSGPQLHLDPDIVAAMDEDFDYDDPENQLEDNFIELAQGVASDDEFNEYDEDNYVDSDYDDEEMDQVGSLNGSERSFDKEETRSRFTNYSMTSSVIRRNEQLQLLDERFEKMFASYDDSEIGGLETEEIEGHIPESSNILLKLAEEFEESQKKGHLDETNEDIKERIKKNYTFEASDQKQEFDYLEVKEKEKWDCESILSTYSNIYNHPKLIDDSQKNRIKINKRTGIPEDVLDANKLTAKALNQFNEQNGDYNGVKGPQSNAGQSVISQLSLLSIRHKDETPEEKKDRKKAFKDYKQERRREKKMNREAFKEESQRLKKIAINNRNNLQGNRIL